MPDISKINAVAVADIEKLDSILAANIEKVNGLTFPTAEPAAAAAYSVRLLDSLLGTTYTGAAMRVREDAGDTETDIGYDSNGDLDVAAIATHCGSANGYVVTWYDQSGNSKDIGNATATLQGIIYNSGTVNVDADGNPFIDMDDAQYALGQSISQPFHAVTVNQVSGDRRFLNFSNFDWNRQNGFQRIASGGQVVTSANTYARFVKHVNSLSLSSGAAVMRLDNALDASGTVATSGIGSDAVVFGRKNVNNWGPEQCYEFIIWPSVRTDISDIETDIETYYSIT